jgi:hypothetical protein
MDLVYKQILGYVLLLFLVLLLPTFFTLFTQ